LKFEEQSPLPSRDGDIDPPRQSNSDPSGVPPLSDPEAPPPGSSRQPFEDLLNWAAELDAALNSNQPLDVSRAPTGMAPLNDLDAFAPSSLEEEPPVDIEGLPQFTPLEDVEPALAWPERSPDPTPPATPAENAVASQGTELERLVQELENDWFVAEPEPAEAVGGNGQANTAIVVDEPAGEATTAAPETDAPPEGAWQEYAPPRRRVSGRTAGIIALIATIAVAGAVLLVLALRGGDDGGTATATPDAVSLKLPSIAIGTTAEVDTEWELSGKDGTQFASTSTFVNRTSTPAQVQFQEVIPKSLASSVDEITFVGPQPTVVTADPVVQYVIDLPANGEVTRTYEIEVAPDGATRTRLAEWARDLDSTSAKREGTLTTTTTSTTTAPETTLPPATEPTPAPTTGRRAPTTTRGGGGPTTPTEPPPTEPPPTEPPPTEPPPTVPPTTVPPTTLPPPTTAPPTTAPPTTAPPTTAAPAV
jgi:hypothetical protein